MSQITKQDLMDSENRIKEYIGSKLDPVADRVNGHQVTLYGPTGRNGLVGDARDMKTGVGIFKWLASTGLVLAIGKWWHSLS